MRAWRSRSLTGRARLRRDGGAGDDVLTGGAGNDNLVGGKVTLRGPVDPTLGWVMDFGDLKTAFRPLHDELDHNYLNDLPGLENPTSERLASWIWERLPADQWRELAPAQPHFIQAASGVPWLTTRPATARLAPAGGSGSGHPGRV